MCPVCAHTKALALGRIVALHASSVFGWEHLVTKRFLGVFCNHSSIPCIIVSLSKTALKPLEKRTCLCLRCQMTSSTRTVQPQVLHLAWYMPLGSQKDRSRWMASSHCLWLHVATVQLAGCGHERNERIQRMKEMNGASPDLEEILADTATQMHQQDVGRRLKGDR